MKYPLRLLALSALLLFPCVSVASDAWGAVPPHSSPSEENQIQSSEAATLTIPGPLRPFLRMAAISQKVSPAEVAPLLAHNIFLQGYQGRGSDVQPTEFLLLLRQYVQQARELAALAGPDGMIRVSGCPNARQLLETLGYRARPDCGRASTFLETADPQRAFLTIDSGFPLPNLERTLQGGSPFAHPYSNSRVPVILTERDWMEASEEGHWGRRAPTEFLDALLHDPALARLYYAWTRMDPDTQTALQQSPGLKKLAPLGAAQDFYGRYILIRAGRVVVPGGLPAEQGWKDLVGASPESPGEFVLRLLAKDNGWLAAYFDSLSRLSPVQQAHFTESPQLRRFYEALRGKDTSPSATVGVLRPDLELLLLMTRLQWDPNGDPHVPGNVQAWKNILSQKANADIARSRRERVRNWSGPQGLLEVLFALSRVQVVAGPCQAYLALSELDHRRPEGHALSPQTVELMARKFSEFNDQYFIFSEFPELSDGSIALFLGTAEALGRIPDRTLRGNAMGIFQANTGLWQILARQGQIALRDQDDSWQKAIRPFARVSSPAQLFDLGRESLGEVLRAATGKSQASQNEIVDLIAGPRQASPAGLQMHAQMADKVRGVLEDQRLVSLDTLWALGDGLGAMARGAPIGDNLVPLAEQLQEFQMPRPIFSRGERIEFTSGTYNNRHTESQMRTDLAKILKSPVTGGQLEEARGELTPFLRDTLVGLNYAYYQPPGAQALRNNPLLVRSHDFAGETVIGMDRQLWQTPRLFGAGIPAGGGAHLVGSLAELPRVLAEMEQNFIAPENVQALIWSDLVPGVLTDAVLPRWWDVTRNELHGIALYQRAGQELLAASAENEELRGKVVSVLSDRMTPQMSSWLQNSLRERRPEEVSLQVTPADLFYLTAELRRRFPGQIIPWGPAGQELKSLTREHPAELSWERLSQDFGVAHPILAGTYARELLDLRPFPMFEGYSSRLLAETWDSTNLYWARLVDEMGYPPVALNQVVPALTLRMVAKIFATDQDDWPAILRAMREAGEEFRQGKVASLSLNSGALRP